VIVVIQCAATKRPEAGFLRDGNGTPVTFVGAPGLAPGNPCGILARPDDPVGDGRSWRDVLLQYNEEPSGNPYGLLPASELYANPVYRRLNERFGDDRTYILSAGWGLIRSDFLTPAYDITFSGLADPWKRRRGKDVYRDLAMLPVDTDEPVVFLGSKDYLPLFLSLTDGIRGPRTVVYRSVHEPEAPGCKLHRFETRTMTNWHYQAAEALLCGALAV